MIIFDVGSEHSYNIADMVTSILPGMQSEVTSWRLFAPFFTVSTPMLPGVASGGLATLIFKHREHCFHDRLDMGTDLGSKE